MMYVILDSQGKIARRINGKLGIFTSKSRLNSHAWRYMESDKQYTIKEFNLDDGLDIMTGTRNDYKRNR